MKYTKVLIIYMLMLIFALSLYTVHAEEQCSITCTTQAYDTDVTISGKIENATGKNQVTLMVGEPNNIIYINQVESSENGEFEFSFKLWEDIPEAGYSFKIGSNSGAEPYIGVLKESKKLIAVQNKFIDATADIEINGYTPYFSAEIFCIDDTVTTVKIVNRTDNIIIGEENITSGDVETTYISYILPSLLSRKEYEISVICKDGDENILAQMSVNIDSHLLSVDITGEISTADNVVIDAQLKTVNTGLVDKETKFKGYEAVDVSVPNLVSNASFKFFAEGYKTDNVESLYNCEYVKETTEEDENSLFSVAINSINLANIKDKTFTVTYPKDNLRLVDDSKFTPDYDISKGNISGTNIIVTERIPGLLKFKVNENIPEGKKLNKTVNIIEFLVEKAGIHKIECVVQGEAIE